MYIYVYIYTYYSINNCKYYAPAVNSIVHAIVAKILSDKPLPRGRVRIETYFIANAV